MRSLSASALAGFAIVGLSVGLASCGGTQTVGAAPAGAIPFTITETSSTMSSTVFPEIGVSGVDLNFTLPPTSASGPVTATISTGAPSGVTPYAGARAAAGTRKTDATQITPVAYVQLTSSVTVTVSALPMQTFNLSSLNPSAVYSLSETETGTYQNTEQNPTITGSSVAFPSIAGSFTVTPTTPVTFVLLAAVTTATATPSASPTASPTPTPSLSPSMLAFDASNPGQTQNLVIANAGTSAATGAISCIAAPTPSPTATPTEEPTPGDGGEFVPSHNAPDDGASPDPNAFVAQFANGASAIVTPSGGTATFAVIGGDQAGTCTATLTTGGGTILTAMIDVSSVSGGLYSIHRVKH